jgi:sec-independent protein translocase protein TatA
MPFIPNIGPGELILILIIALVVLGPGKLPDVAQSLGRSLREFRKAATDVSDAARIDAPAPTPPTTPPPSPNMPAVPAAPAVPEPAASEVPAEPVGAGSSSTPDSKAS